MQPDAPRFWTVGILLLLSAALAGCATVPPQDEPRGASSVVANVGTGTPGEPVSGAVGLAQDMTVLPRIGEWVNDTLHVRLVNISAQVLCVSESGPRTFPPCRGNARPVDVTVVHWYVETTDPEAVTDPSLYWRGPQGNYRFEVGDFNWTTTRWPGEPLGLAKFCVGTTYCWDTRTA